MSTMLRATMLRRAAAHSSMLRRAAAHSSVRRLASAVDLDAFRYVKVEQEGRVGVISLDRPKELNALNNRLANELVQAVRALDEDSTVHAMVIAGSTRAFAAGVDVGEIASFSAKTARDRDEGVWMDAVAAVRKPVVAAVSGFALGAGCELAMVADVVIADRDAKFGLPDIALGTHPGHGGTQRLIRAVGKAKAMEMILTGRQMLAEEAESSGLVSRLAEAGQSKSEALDVAKVIAKHSLPVLMAAKECVNVAADMSLKDGLLYERRSYQSTFGLHDFKEGIEAWQEQREPEFANK